MKKDMTWVKASLSGIIVFFSFYLSVIYKSGADFDWKLILAYMIMGLIIALFSWSLSAFKIKYGPEVLLLATIISGIYLYTAIPKGSDGFSELAAGLGWFMLMGVSVGVLLLYAVIVIIRRKF